MRLAVYCAALVVFGHMLRTALIVRADSLVLLLAGLCIWLVVLIVRAYRKELRRLRRRRADFLRLRTPQRGFPKQPKRPHR